MNSIISATQPTFGAKVNFYNSSRAKSSSAIDKIFEKKTLNHPELTLNQYVMSSLHEDLFGLSDKNGMRACMLWANYSNQCYKTIEENVNTLLAIFYELLEKEK